MADALQWETRLLQLGNELTAHIFFPAQTADQTIEVEWSLNDVTSWVWMSSQVDKRREKYRSNKDKIDVTYGRMYGRTRPEPRQCLNQKKKNHDDVMMYERTIPTRELAAVLSFALSNPDFGQEQAFRINSFCSRLFAHLCQVNLFQGKVLSIPCLGGEGRKVQVPVGGFVSSAAVWPEGLRSVLEDVWTDATGDRNRPWYRSTCENISIPEFMMFGLDAMNSRTFSFLQIAAEDVLKQLFELLKPQTCHEWACEPEDLSRAPGTTKTIRKGLRVQGYFKACQSIVDGEVPLTKLKEHIFLQVVFGFCISYGKYIYIYTSI